MSPEKPRAPYGRLRRDLLAWLLLAVLAVVALVAAGYAVLDPGAVN